VYSGRNEALVGPILEQFTEETGIEVAFRPGDSGELAAQLLTESDASPADVFFSQDAGALGAVEQAGLLSTMPDELLSIVPVEFRSTEGRWVGISGRVRVLAVNPELVPEPPTTIDELLDPQWKGKLGFAPSNASWQSFVTALRLTRGEDGATAWLEGFKAQEPVAYEGNAAVRDAVDAGDVAIGLVNHYYVYEKIEAEGEGAVTVRNQFLAPGDPGGLINVAGVGVLESSDKKEAALQLVEFLLGETGQAYFAETTFEYPLREGVAIGADLPELSSLQPLEIDLSDLSSIEQTQALLSDVGLLTL
jgi:iron(III) transport system substrate-binding protein